MTLTGLKPNTLEIVVDEVLPHAAETIWRTLTTPELMERWMMPPTGFEARVGNHFTFHTTAAGAWDGTIRCEVLDVVPARRLSYSWRGGDDANVGYGSRLDTVVTWTLTPTEAGTRVKMVHSGFEAQRNDTAYRTMSQGWVKVVRQLDALTGKDE